jgi:hypothetical protein
MRRIKIIKVIDTNQYDYDHPETFRTIAEGIDWHEVDDARYLELVKLISYANQYRYQLKADYILQIVEEIVPATVELHLAKAKELYDQHQAKLQKQREKEEKARAAREKKRKETELDKKRKQLEKLQKELSQAENSDRGNASDKINSGVDKNP